jgi:hypothetical protein
LTGVTTTGTTARFTSGAFQTVTGTTVTGTTANFTSGNFNTLNGATATISGALVMANQQPVRFREAAINGVNHIAVQAPAIVSADQVITLPDQTGTVVTTGDNGSVTSTMILDGTILNVDINASAAIADTKLATISTAGKVSNSATTATNANTASAIVRRDASGNFSAGTITANLTGTASNVTTNANLSGDVTSVGNTTSIAAGVIVNADINASAAIGYSKLAALNSANILVGSAANVPTARAVTGDVTIGNTGITAIASGVIVDADINASAAISLSKLDTGALPTGITVITRETAFISNGFQFGAVYTNLPNTAKRIVILFNGISTNGSSVLMVRIGTGGTNATTGYTATAINNGNTDGISYTTGFGLAEDNAATRVVHGICSLFNITGNTWICQSSLGDTSANKASLAHGSITLSGTLNRVDISTVNGTDRFDAGSINIICEG